MNLKFKKLLCVLSMLWVAQLSIHAQTTKEVVEIKVPGTLQKVIDDLESSRFESLTIKGGLNAVDIAYLTSGKNKVAMIETLDLSDVTLIPSDESYKTIRVGSAPGGAYGYSYNIYYISNTYKVVAMDWAEVMSMTTSSAMICREHFMEIAHLRKLFFRNR